MSILILVLTVIIISAFVWYIGNSQDAPEKANEPFVDKLPTDTTEALENSLGTLSDRAKAALQYQRLQNSFIENCQRDPETAKLITNQVRYNFEQMAKQLATIGTNVKPEDVQTTPKDGLPPGWELN